MVLLREGQIDYMVTGSLVSSMQGEPRATQDADILVNITSAAIPLLLKNFTPSDYYISETAIEEAIRYKTMFNLLDTKEGDTIDFRLLTDESFGQSGFERKYEERILGVLMKVSGPEDTILMKLRWAKLSGGSEKHFTDALRVYEVQAGIMDLSYMDLWAVNLEIKEL